MEKDEARLNYFKELRESGLTKLFEEDVRIFFGGIVSSTRNPMNKEKLLEIFKQMPEAILPIQLEEHIVGLIKDTDNRYTYRSQFTILWFTTFISITMIWLGEIQII